jgi:hypothetical protein
MRSGLFRGLIAVFAVLGLVAPTSPARPQGNPDPIGNLKKTSTFDRAQKVNVGKSSKGKVVCFIEDEGSDSTLYIGMSDGGPFIRLEAPEVGLPNPSNFDPALPLVESPTPKPPVRFFAGKDVTKVVNGDEKATGEYAPLQGDGVYYSDAVNYTPLRNTKYGYGFVVIPKGDAKSFFDVIVRAAAAQGLIVVQSVAEPKNLDGAAISDFKTSTISALLACAKKHIR